MELDFSLGGLLGAIGGTVVAAAVYGPLASRIERSLRARPREVEDTARLRQELTLMRHSLLTCDILLFGGIGYWVGDRIGS